MADRIWIFATEIVDHLADFAGEAIRGVSCNQARLKNREAVIDEIFERFRFRAVNPISDLGRKLFCPSTPWSEEAAWIAGRLVRDAFHAALEQKSIWDRRRSARSITILIKIEMDVVIDSFCWDRGMSRDGQDGDELDIGDITVDERGGS